jgi:hypothetical protein
MIKFQQVVLNSQIAMPLLSRQYSAISLPFFGKLYILLGKFIEKIREISMHTADNFNVSQAGFIQMHQG